MNLLERLKVVGSARGLSLGAQLKILCTDGQEIEGGFVSYTEAYDNEPEIAQLDIRDKNGFLVGILETEIESLEAI